MAFADTPSATFPPEQRLGVALLLSAAGGSLDAFTWLVHGGVFANAQSGNVVLLGVFAASGQWRLALSHVPPIIAFFAGIFVAHRLRLHGTRAGDRRAARFSLMVEIALLAVVAVLPPHTPDLPIVLGVAFVAALQSSSFAQVEGWSYNSVMTTGNLRRSAEALFAGAAWPPNHGQPDHAALRQARVFGAVCACFALGAALGGLCAERLGDAAVVAPILLCLWALALCFRRERPEGSQSS